MVDQAELRSALVLLEDFAIEGVNEYVGWAMAYDRKADRATDPDSAERHRKHAKRLWQESSDGKHALAVVRQWLEETEV